MKMKLLETIGKHVTKWWINGQRKVEKVGLLEVYKFAVILVLFEEYVLLKGDWFPQPGVPWLWLIWSSSPTFWWFPRPSILPKCNISCIRESKLVFATCNKKPDCRAMNSSKFVLIHSMIVVIWLVPFKDFKYDYWFHEFLFIPREYSFLSFFWGGVVFYLSSS